MKLTYEQVRFFRQAGYLKIPERMPKSAIERMREAVTSQMAERIPPFVQDKEERIVRLPNIAGRGQIFLEAFTSPTILDPLESLLGPNIELVLNRHNHATVTLKSGDRPRLHRDILQWSRSLVTAIIYLEETTVENGCTHVVPGSQYLPFVGIPNNGGTWMDEHTEYTDLLSQSIPIPMPEGGLLLLDSLMFHCVGTNQTDGTRMSIAIGYHSVDELSGISDDPKRLLVRGARIYKGNDIQSGGRSMDAGGLRQGSGD